MQREQDEKAHLERIISEDKRRIVANEHKNTEMDGSIAKTKKDLEEREVTRAKLDGIKQTLDRQLER
jgi:hypothetical protein